MAIVLMNGDVSGVAHSAKSWGELLDGVEQHLAGSGDVVAAVRVGDVEMPAFRTPEALSQALDVDVEVYINTARPADLIRQTLDEADAAAQAIAEAAVALGGSYRQADIAAANRALPEFADNLSTLIVATSSVAQGAGVDLSVAVEGDLSALQAINSLIALMDLLLAAQQAGDWTQMGRVIESDIAMAMRRWPLVLEAIRRAAPGLTEAA